MEEATTRQRLADALRGGPATPRQLSEQLGVATSTVYEHVSHIAQSLEREAEQFLVAPPECRECGFDGFDDPLNDPSRCPECKSERIAEPRFVIEQP